MRKQRGKSGGVVGAAMRHLMDTDGKAGAEGEGELRPDCARKALS